jgi:hypothetical protein
MIRYLILLFISILFCITVKGQHLTIPADSVYSYKNNQDSIRIIYKKNKLFKKIYYYPDGKIKAKALTTKDKPSKGRIKRKTIIIYTTWGENGKITKKVKEKHKQFDVGEKQVSWVLKKDGKRCLKRKIIRYEK